MIWKVTESTCKPLDVDDTSSKNTIYFHRDISEKIVEANDGENSGEFGWFCIVLYSYLKKKNEKKMIVKQKRKSDHHV